MIFDTIARAANTGHLTAACITIQQSLGRPLLWSGCRHHVRKVLLSHVFEALKIETSKSSEIALFSRFKKKFELFSHGNMKFFCVRDLSDHEKNTVAELKTRNIPILLTTTELCRDDYKEYAKLSLPYLGVGSEEPVTLRRPGALHKARWISKLLYSIKMCLLEDQIMQLPRGTVATKCQLSKRREFVDFATLIYSPWWSMSPSSVDAPWCDLALFKELINYAVINPVISACATRALKRHLWYVNTEMLPLALFSKIVPHKEKHTLAERLLALKPHNDDILPISRFGKPTFSKDINLDTTLASIATKDSWLMVRVLDVD